jgi:hypothetical protein
MAERRWVAVAAVLGVVTAAAVGAVLLWPDGSATRHVSTPIASASSSPADEVVDGIPNGSRVSTTGTVARVAGRLRLCLWSAEPLMYTDDYCSQPVYLRDPDGLLAGAVGKKRIVTGIWESGWIEVGTAERAPAIDYAFDLVDPPCPTPAGGWAYLQEYNPKTPNIDYRAFEAYRRDHPRVVTGVASFRPSELQPVLVLDSTDPQDTRAALASAYPDALCVVRSEFTWDELHDAKRQLDQALKDGLLPGVIEFGTDMQPDGQTRIALGVRNARAEIDDVIGGMPKGLVDLQTVITVLDQP